jgi:hypothetical protein
MKNGILFLGLLSFIGVFCYGQTKNRIVGALNPTMAPGGNFDLSIWSLQMPTGSGTLPTTVPPALLAGAGGFTDSNYFFTDKTDGAQSRAVPLPAPRIAERNFAK